MKWIHFHLFIFLLSATISWCQTDSIYSTSKPTFIGVSLDYGYVLQHTSSLREIGDAYPSAISLDWSKLMLTEKAWEFCNCFPRIGADAAFWNYDKKDILGYSIIAMGYIEPYFRTQKRLNLFFRMGLGGAYQTEPFNADTNPLNETYSTYLSFAIMAGFGVNYRLTNAWNLRFLAKYNHTSNGGVNVPNKGINFPSLSFGIAKSLVPVNYPNLDKVGERLAPKDKERFTLSHFSGWSNARVEDKDKFYVFGFSGKYSRWIGGRSALTAGTEVILDYSRKEQLKLNEKSNNFLQASALLGHEFWLGRVNFGQELGIYYFNDYRINDDVYQRYTLLYNFNPSFFAGFGLKAHRNVADFFDLRFGYRF